MNVDKNEIGKFSGLASKWWDTSGEFKPLHKINPVRMGYIQSNCDLEKKNILDIGCGGGILSESMAKAGANVTGIDMSEKALNVAKLHLHESNLNVNYHMTTAETFSEKNNAKFDIITCLEMLEHVPQPSSILNACHRMLKPGGHMFISTLNRNFKSFILAIIGAEHVLNIMPKGTHHYEKFITPAELTSACRNLNFEAVSMAGFTLNPITWKAKLTKSCDVNYIAHFVKA